MPHYHTIVKEKKPLPDVAFELASYNNAPVWILPTRTLEKSVREFWFALNHGRQIDGESPLYCFEILFNINKFPEIGTYNSDLYYSKNGVDGWYMIGDLDLYNAMETFWSANRDFWIINADSNFGV